MHMRNLIIAVSVVIPVLIFAESPQRSAKKYRAVINASGVQVIELVGGEYYFDPNYIIVKKDVPVEFVLKKRPGIVPHNIVINEADAGIDVREALKKSPGTVRFVPRKVGKFPFYCDKKLLFFANHRKKGMEGIIEVIE